MPLVAGRNRTHSIVGRAFSLQPPSGGFPGDAHSAPAIPKKTSYNERMRILAMSLFVTATVFAQPGLEPVEGRISAINRSGFEVDQNFNADPQSGYRRGKRQIRLNSKTKFEESARQDLRV